MSVKLLPDAPIEHVGKKNEPTWTCVVCGEENNEEDEDLCHGYFYNADDDEMECHGISPWAWEKQQAKQQKGNSFLKVDLSKKKAK